MLKNREMNMCEGALLKKIIIYALPLLATNVLQLLFNATDVAVLGKFISNKDIADQAVAAVGSTNALINLIIGLFVGLSVGANVLIARYVGEQNKDGASKTVCTSMVISVIFGCILLVIGTFFSRTFLEWMKCDPKVIEMATKYMRIYFIGMPIMMLYNFSASILRAVGDTLRPFIFLVIGGVVNIVLNIFFVVVFKKNVEGVAVATVTSQGISAVLCIITLIKTDGFCHLAVKKLGIYKIEFVKMLKIGLPAGLQGCVFSLSNVLIQSSINSFGDVVMAANTVAGQIDGFIYNAMNAVALSSLAFVSQNLGAGRIDRVKKTTWEAILSVSVLGLFVGSIVAIFRVPFCHIITDSEEVIEIASKRLLLLGFTYLLCGIMDVMSNVMRGLGKSTLAMIISLSGSCLFRILWLNTVFRISRTYLTILFVYPVSYVLTVSIYFCIYFPMMKKLERKLAKKEETKENITDLSE